MKTQRQLKITIFFLLGSCIFLLGIVNTSYAIKDSIIAIVNDDLITLKDYQEYLTTIYMQLKSTGKSEEDIQRIMKTYERDGLVKLIDDRLILSEAERRQITVRQSAVDDRIAEIKGRYPSEQMFIDELVQDGMTVSDLRKRLEGQMKAKYLLEFEVREKIFVNPQEVTDYYEANKNDYMKPERFNLESIFIPKKEGRSKAKEQAAEAYKKIKDGNDFKITASTYSHLPSIGIIARDQLLPEIESVVSNMKVGDSSHPIETETGFYLFQLKEILPAECATLNEAKDKVYRQIFQLKYRKRLRKWVDELRANAFVEIKDQGKNE